MLTFTRPVGCRHLVLDPFLTPFIE
jgi:hypothetical protein